MAWLLLLSLPLDTVGESLELELLLLDESLDESLEVEVESVEVVAVVVDELSDA